jgi:NitT/TauT family transport system substrate-binding protein
MQKQLPKITPPTEKLIVSSVDTPGFALLYIAQNKGYFKDEGLEVTNKRVPRGVDALTDAVNGDSDIAFAFEAPVVRKIFEGEKLKIISIMHTSTENVAIAGRKDKGITVSNDLKGKRIGVTKTSSYEFFLYSYLLSQGIPLRDVTIVDGEHADWATALKDGKVDAVATGNPFIYNVKKEFPEGSLSIFQSEVYTEHALMSASDNSLKNKKEVILKFLRALKKAEDFTKSNNQEALEAVVAELPSFSAESIRDTWDQFTPTLKLDNVLLTLLNREGQWFRDNGIYTTEVPDFRKAIFTDYLKSVKPDAVTIY